MPSFRGQVSEALDAFTQKEGAIIVRTLEGWRALEKPGPDHVLATDEDGNVVWVPDSGGPVSDTGWIDITPNSPWALDSAQPDPYCQYRVIGNMGFWRGQVRDSTGQMTGSIVTIPSSARPSEQWFTRVRSGNGRRDLKIQGDGNIFILSAPAQWNVSSIMWPVAPTE